MCSSVRWLQRILDVCQAYAELHGIIFNCSKTVCMTFEVKSAKSTVTPLLTLGGQNVKSVKQYKYLGTVSNIELSDDKDVQRQLRYQHCAANKLRAFFPMFKRNCKCTFSFLLYAHVCITIIVQVEEVMHAAIARGLYFWMQSSVQPAQESEC